MMIFYRLNAHSCTLSSRFTRACLTERLNSAQNNTHAGATIHVVHLDAIALRKYIAESTHNPEGRSPLSPQKNFGYAMALISKSGDTPIRNFILAGRILDTHFAAVHTRGLPDSCQTEDTQVNPVAGLIC